MQNTRKSLDQLSRLVHPTMHEICASKTGYSAFLEFSKKQSLIKRQTGLKPLKYREAKRLVNNLVHFDQI